MTAPQSTGSAGGAATLCERPIALAKDVLRRRIYAPTAYATARNLAVVPIVPSECLALASWFPLVWRRDGSTLVFVAVRALLNDQRAQPPAARALLPLILHAYPFVFDPDQPIGPTSEKMLDDVFADAPTDIGATITTVHHRLSRATTSRFQVLDRFAHEMSVTNAVGHALDALDVFEPWPLRFNIDGHLVEVPNLLVIRPSAFDGGLLAPLLERYGMPCAQMLGLHRVSLYRAGVLLVMAKAVLKAVGDSSRAEHSDVSADRSRQHDSSPTPHLQPAAP
jgi:hypothetical protein